MQHRGLASAENRNPFADRFDEQHQNHHGQDSGDGGIQTIIENQPLGDCDFFGGNRAGRNLGRQNIGL